MAKGKDPEVDKMSYEEAFAELGALVESLETHDHPLDETMQLFERGQALARHCTQLLEKADLKVKQLIGDSIQDLGEN